MPEENKNVLDDSKVEIVDDDLKALGIVNPEEEEKEEKKSTEENKDNVEKLEEKKSRAQERIETLIAEKKALEQKLRSIEKKYKKVRKMAKRTTTKQTETETEPELTAEDLDPADFDSYDDYLKAVEELEKKSSKKKETKQVEVEEPEEDEEDEEEEEGETTDLGVDPDTFMVARDLLLDKFEESKAEERIKDFKEKVFAEDVPFTPAMVVALSRLDNPTEVAYYLATHKSTTRNIATLEPVEMGVELAKLERSLISETNKVSKKVTQAPPPINPIKTGSEITPSPEKMSYEEYEAWRNAQERKKKFW